MPVWTVIPKDVIWEKILICLQSDQSLSIFQRPKVCVKEQFRSTLCCIWFLFWCDIFCWPSFGFNKKIQLGWTQVFKACFRGFYSDFSLHDIFLTCLCKVQAMPNLCSSRWWISKRKKCPLWLQCVCFKILLSYSFKAVLKVQKCQICFYPSLSLLNWFLVPMSYCVKGKKWPEKQLLIFVHSQSQYVNQWVRAFPSITSMY